ncbi:MAG: type II secretion system protein N [Betaproteobacteria bacterium]
MNAHITDPRVTSPRILQRMAITLTGLLIGALGVQLGYWTWQMIAPSWRDANVTRQPAAMTISPSLGRQLFGDKDGEGLVTAAPAAVNSSVRLRGVFAVDGKTLSAAVVNLGGKDRTIYLNQEFAAGTRLVEVQGEYIVINRNGVHEKIELDRFASLAPKGAASAAANQPAATTFRLNVATTGANAFSLSRQELNTVLQDPRQMNFLGRIGPGPTGGVRVEDAPAGSLSNKLGLQAGDIITAINGQPINSPGDLARVYAQFNTITAIRAEVRRGGAPVTLNYNIQN